MTRTEHKALLAEVKRNLHTGRYGLYPEQWVTLLNCYRCGVYPAECAALIHEDTGLVRSIFLDLALVSVQAAFREIDAVTASFASA